jgi:hypothetical protein
MNSTPHSRNDSGLATVEFAIVGSLLLMLVFAIGSLGILWGAKQQVAFAANEAAHAASVHVGYTPPTGITLSGPTATLCPAGSFSSFNVTATKSVSPPNIPFVSGALPSTVSQTVKVQCIG